MSERTTCFFGCVTTVTEPNLLRPLGLLLSERQVPQIVVMVRNHRETMESLEPVIVLHTQEVTASSPVAPTIKSIGFYAVDCSQRIDSQLSDVVAFATAGVSGSNVSGALGRLPTASTKNSPFEFEARWSNSFVQGQRKRLLCNQPG